ncbi:putative PTS IIA-like nitrogen-regulatory protein PtsN [Caldalkalibacillus thermarum TA2.A1]|uniref:Fructose PTS transporter subunit IIA n=1 Tax=Caldalkalibacillus thermarum (strain TA2.A1) TaxID=986075 RepID=F5L6B8_CALTT|nr:fructose PTS transporter subunit IIA [Caldalkalibacillus thermarum]EGL83118.1 putative PTS IIA-like nitrogen-regulatory protein PtsN [Caldalkalibacillus thermarum TA2.A1]QZT32468.1 fructose PTS transporter subunit IIA [Caldalkalibacillus thermarum TA2.A1]
MNLKELLKEEAIQLSLSAETKEEYIRKLASVLHETGAVSDKEQYVQKVLEREQMGSTGVGFGVAIPHGKSRGVQSPGLAFARLTAPIDWDALDGQPVKNVFLIAVPEEQAGDAHLKILASLSRKLMHENFRQQLNQAETAEDIFSALEC